MEKEKKEEINIIEKRKSGIKVIEKKLRNIGNERIRRMEVEIVGNVEEKKIEMEMMDSEWKGNKRKKDRFEKKVRKDKEENEKGRKVKIEIEKGESWEIGKIKEKRNEEKEEVERIEEKDDNFKV